MAATGLQHGKGSSLLAIVANVISPRLPTKLPASTLLLATRATLLKGVGLPRTALSWTALALAPERLVIALALALALCLPRSNVKISFNIDSCWNDSVNVHENSMLNTALQPVQYAAIQTLQEPRSLSGLVNRVANHNTVCNASELRSKCFYSHVTLCTLLQMSPSLQAVTRLDKSLQECNLELEKTSIGANRHVTYIPPPCKSISTQVCDYLGNRPGKTLSIVGGQKQSCFLAG